MKVVGIANLKAHLSEYLRAVRQGQPLTVLDRSTPVARIVPIETGPLEIRRATRRPDELPPTPPLAVPTDSLTLLIEDRRRR